MKTIEEQLVGVWMHRDSDVEYTIALHPDVRPAAFLVTAVDRFDDEVIEIREVRFDGESLYFLSVVPSNGYALEHWFRISDRDMVEHVSTLTENWFRKPGSVFESIPPQR